MSIHSSLHPLEASDGTRTTILVHYYRAMVGRADIWRIRMDATTNWAIGATAAVPSFALGNPDSPHYVIHLAAFLTIIFLLLEARRLTFYHLWQQRVLLLERTLIAGAITRVDPSVPEPATRDLLAEELTPQLGETAPTMSLGKAAARRLRRVYLYLFGVQLAAWTMKLAIHPSELASFAALPGRAAIGPVPGPVVLLVSLLSFALAVGLAVLRGGRGRS